MKYLLITLILILGLSSNLLAEIDLSYELPDQLPIFGPGGAFETGILWPALGDLNNELKSMGLGGIGAGSVFGGAIGYSFTPNFQVAYEGLGWNGYSTAIISDIVKSVSLSAAISSLDFIYKFPYGRDWNVSLGCAPSFFHVAYKKEITDGTYQYGDGQTGATSISELEGNAFGVRVFTRLKYIFNPIISLSLSVGYQYAKIKELSQAGIRMPQAPMVDLSGVSINCGAHLNF